MFTSARSRGVLSLFTGMLFFLSTLPTSAAEVPSEVSTIGTIAGFGELEVRGVPVHSGNLADGDHIRTGPFSYANVFLVNGNLIELSGRTDLVVTKVRKQDVQLRLTAGRVAFTASSDHLTITLGQHEVEPSAGSSGTVEALEDFADVRITAGTVKLRDASEKKTSKISAGAQRILKLDSSTPDGAGPQISSAAPVTLPPAPPQAQTPTKKSKWPLILGLGFAGAAAFGVIAATNGERPQLTMEMGVSSVLFHIGSTQSFTLKVGNYGEKATRGTITVTDTFPLGFTPIQPTASEAPGWACSINNGQTLTCTRSDALAVGSLYPAITVRVDVVGAVNTVVPTDSRLNRATASGGDAKNTASDSASVIVQEFPDVTLTKSASSPSFTRGSTGRFTLAVGLVPFKFIDAITVTDTFPAGLTPIQPTESEAPGWGCSISSQTLTCTLLTIEDGQVSDITVRANVELTAAESLTNTATATATCCGLQDTATSSVTVSTVAPASSLLFAQVLKEADRPAVTLGETIGFNIGVTNPSTAMPDDFAVHDTLPLGFQYRTGSAKVVITRPDGTAVAPVISSEPFVNSAELVFPVGALPAGSRVVITYSAVVRPNAQLGEFLTRAVGVATSAGKRASTSPGQVRVTVSRSAFSLTQVLIGRVFEDLNKNEKFDSGEPGVAGVRIVTSSGLTATTDPSGQYNIAGLAAGSVVVAVDPTTLPVRLQLPSNTSRLGGGGALLRTPLEGGGLLRQNFALVGASDNSVSEGDEIPSGGARRSALRIEIVPERSTMTADGMDRQLVRVHLLDPSNRPIAGRSIVVTTTAGTIVSANTEADQSSCGSVVSAPNRTATPQRLVLEATSAETAICLTSDSAPGGTRLTATTPSHPDAAANLDVRFGTREHAPMLIAVGELGIGLSRPAKDATYGARRADASASIFYQDSLRKNDLLTVAVRTKEGVNNSTGAGGLFESDPTQHLYPVMGDASTHKEMAQSSGHLFARYDLGKSYVMYGDLQGDLPGDPSGDLFDRGRSDLLEFDRNVTGFRFQLQGSERAALFQGQIARPRTAYAREVFNAAGSAIRLSGSQILRGSETITLEVRDRRNPERIVSREALIRNVDYVLDPLSGVLYVTRPLSLFDRTLNVVQVVTSYEYQTAGADSMMYLGRGFYSFDKLGIRVGGSLLNQSEAGANFSIGGVELEKSLPNGGRFKAEMPVSNGHLLRNPNSVNGTWTECCEINKSYNGKAIRAELEQPVGFLNAVVRGRFSSTDETFFNPYGSITVPGQRYGGGSLEVRAFENTTLKVGFEDEVNHNNAVDNRRQTVSTRVTHNILSNLIVEGGVDRRAFEDFKDGSQTDSALVSGGLRWRPGDRLETSIRHEQNLRAADPTYPDQTVLGAQFNMTPESRLFATQRFSSAPIVPIGGGELAGLFSPLSTRETAIGMETRLRENTNLTTKYRMDSGIEGTDSFAVFGVLTRLPVRSGVSIDWSIDNALHLAGAGQGYIGGSVALSQSNDRVRTFVRYELRRRDVLEHLFSMGVVGRLADSMFVLARYRIADLRAGAATRLNDAQLALSVRPKQSDRVALLFSYDYGLARNLTTGSSAGNPRTDRLSVDGLIELGHGVEFYSRLSMAHVNEVAGGHRLGTFVQSRLQKSLSRRFDVAGEARWIRESAHAPGTLIPGVEWGTWVTRDLRIGLGYSPRGFANPGSLLNSTAARGGAYLVISSKLSGIFDLMVKG